MSTREEEIKTDIADAKADKAKVEALIVEAGKKNNDAYLLKLEDRLNEITKHIANLHANLENERQRMATPLSKYNNLNKFVF